MKLEYIIKNNNYSNLRQVLTQEFSFSNRLLTKLKKENKIFLNKENTYIDKAISINDLIEVFIDFEEDNSNIVATKLNLNILYEDDCFLIINKNFGIAIHPSILHYDTSLSNGVKYYFDSINLKRKIRPVNRLDKDTSGIVIFAKNEYVQECLVKQMKNNIFKKEYIAIVEGTLEKKNDVIDLPISRKENSIIERCVSPDGEYALTEYNVEKEFNDLSLLHITIKTGRTHQIRVHMSNIGHPILGDTLYGKTSNLISRQALHAYKVEFVHPISKKKMKIIAPLPDDIKNII